MDLLASFNLDPLEIFISPNGLDSVQGIINRAEKSADRYFVAIGTYSYKRLDLLISWFRRNASLYDDCRLKIIGSVPKDSLFECSSVDWLGPLPHDQVLMYLSNSIGYISFSEIENSSNALAEAALFQKKLVLSKIPSHTEFLDQNQIKYIANDNILETTELYHFNRSNIDWVDVNTKLLDRIKLL
jgi:glycosyltransferase involved in cell wall biosynthesis